MILPTRAGLGCLVVALAVAVDAAGADFGVPGAPEPANVDEITEVLRQEPYDLELLISYGTSKGGSAGHLALAIRDSTSGDDTVHSANFYADRAPEHEKGYFTDDRMVAVPKNEYLFGTASSLGATAALGLDFGEVYKRSGVGVRVRGVPAAEKQALAAFFKRINDDYRRRAPKTGYHGSEIKYDYLHLNRAKTIGSAFKYGAGYRDVEITSSMLSARRKVASAVNANIPTEMAMKLFEAWNARGYGMDVVLYRKYPSSPYVDPHDDDKVAFKDLPARFPSVLSRDFRRDDGEYEDFDNLFAMYLLHNMGKYAVRFDAATNRLEIDAVGRPLAYPEAAEVARQSAASDSENNRRSLRFRPRGSRIGAAADDGRRQDVPAAAKATAVRQVR